MGGGDAGGEGAKQTNVRGGGEKKKTSVTLNRVFITFPP